MILLSGLDIRDFDLEHSMRNMLGGSGASSSNCGGSSRRNQSYFSPPNWGQEQQVGGANVRQPQHHRRQQQQPRPPHYMGGGMGMQIHDSEWDAVPFPYSNTTSHDNSDYYSYSTAHWYSFQHSDTYMHLESDYDTLVSSYSDANMLAMFVADHPFHARAALQLAMVFYRTGNVDRGTEMLRRAMCVLEHACLPGFLPTITTTSHHNHVSHNRNLMDRDRPENEPFFLALFRWIQTSCMVG